MSKEWICADCCCLETDACYYGVKDGKYPACNKIVVDHDHAYQQGREDVFKDCILDSKEYCWQECCATEHCGECSRLDNGQIDYFDNTFVTHELNYADMPTTP